MDLESLLTSLRACAGGSLVAVAAVFLHHCRSNRSALDTLLGQPHRHHERNQVCLAARLFFEALDSDEVDAEDLQSLTAEVELHGKSLPSALVASGFAHGLDLALGRLFLPWFRQLHPTLRLEAGEPFPVADPPLREVFGRLNSKPMRLEPPLDATERLRLIPAQPRWDVTLSFRATDAMATLSADSAIGFALPNAHPDGEELTWDAYERQGEALFFNVRPRAPEQQEGRIRKLIEEAARQGVALLLLPELCVTQELVEALGSWYRREAARRSLPLVVLGSAHASEAGLRRNRCTTLFPDGSRAEHDKAEPFVLEDGAGTERREDIHAERSLTVHFVGRWSLSTLVCKDFAGTSAVEALRHLGVRIVLVPAFSAKTQAFATNASALAVHAQALCAIANACDPDDAEQPASAILALPRKGPHGLYVRPRADVQPPALLVFRLGVSHSL